MKKIVLKNGLISGLLIATFCIASITICHVEDNYAGNMVIGYTGMLIAFSLIFVGVKSYRDKENGGVISFGKAFQIGLLIALISSAMYVIAWAIDYHFFVPDFMDKYCAAMIKSAKSSGLPQAEINKKIAEMASMKEQYKNPVVFTLYTFIEPFPVGLLVALITALILKRKVPVGSVTIA